MVCVVPGGGFDRYFAAAAEEFKEGEPEMPLLVKLGLSMESSFKAVGRPEATACPAMPALPSGPLRQSSACWSAEIDELHWLRDVFPTAIGG